MDKVISRIDALVPTLQEEYGVPGVGIAMVKDGAVAYARGFGVLEQGGQNPVDENTLFAIGSCTKAFTATAVGLLVQEGKLGWDDLATRYLPYFQLFDPVDTRAVTVRDLLCHRAGLPTFGGDLIFYGSTYTDEEVLERVRLIPPAFRLRAGYGYANIMYLAAGLVIQKVSGMGWDDFVRTRLIEPLGMDRTLTRPELLPGVQNVAQPHQEYNKQLIKVPYIPFHSGAPAGSIVSSPADMAKWLLFQLGGGKVGETQLVAPSILQETRTPHALIPIPADARTLVPRRHFSAYGLGWTLEDYGGRLVCMHSGGVDGMQAWALFIPEEQFGLVILTNRIPQALTSTVNRVAIDALMGFHDRDWHAVIKEQSRKEDANAEKQWKELEAARLTDTSPSLPLAAYAGTYLSPIYGRAAITELGGQLQIHLDPHPQADSPLEHWHADTFFCRWTYPSLEESFIHFQIGLNGKVESLKFKVNDYVDPLEYAFRRVE